MNYRTQSGFEEPPAAWAAGKRFAWHSGDGQVIRHGTLVERPSKSRLWFVTVDAELHPAGYEMPGFNTWLPEDSLTPLKAAR